jgi:hypothetical protein
MGLNEILKNIAGRVDVELWVEKALCPGEKLHLHPTDLTYSTVVVWWKG